MRAASHGKSLRGGGNVVENFDREKAKELGELLRRTREEKGIPLEKAEAATFVSERFLRALEEGTWEILPGKTYTIGYVKIYARFLGLDQEEAVSLCQKAYGEKGKALPTKETKAPKSKKRKRVLFGILVFLIALCSVFLLILFTPLLPREEEGREGTSAVVEVVSPSPSLPPESPAPSFAVVLRLEAERVAWVDVTSLGNTLFSGILIPGKVYTFRSEGPIEVSGDGGDGIRVWYNGEERGYLAESPGSFQEVFTP